MMYIVNSNPNKDGHFDIVDTNGRHVCETVLCEDHQIRPSIAASENIAETAVDYQIDADLFGVIGALRYESGDEDD